MALRPKSPVTREIEDYDDEDVEFTEQPQAPPAPQKKAVKQEQDQITQSEIVDMIEGHLARATQLLVHLKTYSV